MSSMKYTADGRVCQVMAEIAGGGFLVAYQLSAQDGEETWFDTKRPKVVERVFDVAPVDVYDKRVQALLSNIELLQNRRNQLHAEVNEADRIHRERMAKFSKYEALQRIEDFIDGKITHYVISKNTYRVEEDGHYHLSISTPHAERSGNEPRETDLKLLALYGSKERRPYWKLDHYSVSSSTQYFCWPFTSLEDAQAFAKTLFNEACAKAEPRKERAEYLLRSAASIGAEAPSWIAEAIRQANIRGALHSKAEAEKKLAEANALLQTLQTN